MRRIMTRTQPLSRFNRKRNRRWNTHCLRLGLVILSSCLLCFPAPIRAQGNTPSSSISSAAGAEGDDNLPQSGMNTIGNMGGGTTSIGGDSPDADPEEVQTMGDFTQLCKIRGTAPVFSVMRVRETDSTSNNDTDPVEILNWTLVDEGEDSTGDSNNQSRHTHHLFFRRRRQLESNKKLPPSNYDSNNDDDNNNQSAQVDSYQVRECPCAPGVYCELAFDTCGIPSASLSERGRVNAAANAMIPPGYCFAHSQPKTVLRNLWPIVLLWYATMLFLLLCTDKGRHARQYLHNHYLRLCCCCCWPQDNNNGDNNNNSNEAIVDHFLWVHGFRNDTNNNNAENDDDNEANNNNNIIAGILPVARPVQEEEEERGKPTALLLKTRLYKNNNSNGDGDKNSEDNNDHCAAKNTDTNGSCIEPDQDNISNNATNMQQEGENETCTICFAPLQVGDRVGDLACRHTFHVACLREWLPRRNVCPLCQVENAAMPRYAEHIDPSPPGDNDNDRDSSNDNGNDASSPTRRRRHRRRPAEQQRRQRPPERQPVIEANQGS